MKALRRLCEVTVFPPLVFSRHALEDFAAFCATSRTMRSIPARSMDRPLRTPLASCRRMDSNLKCWRLNLGSSLNQLGLLLINSGKWQQYKLMPVFSVSMAYWKVH